MRCGWMLASHPSWCDTAFCRRLAGEGGAGRVSGHAGDCSLQVWSAPALRRRKEDGAWAGAEEDGGDGFFLYLDDRQSLSQDRRLSSIFLHHEQPLLVPTLVYLAHVVPTGQHRTHARWSRKRLTNTTEARSNPTERACVPATTTSAMPACFAGGENRGSEGGAHADGAPHGAGGCSARHVLSPHPSPQRATPRRKGGTG